MRYCLDLSGNWKLKLLIANFLTDSVLNTLFKLTWGLFLEKPSNF